MPRFDKPRPHSSQQRYIFSIHGSTNATLTSATATKPVLDTVPFTATGTAFDTVGQKFLPTLAGKYQLNISASFSSTSAISAFSVQLRRNGGLIWAQSSENVSTDTSVVASSSAIVNFNGSTDYVEVLVSVTSAGTITLTGNALTSLSGFWIGP